ncbi:MAG: ROK family protein [Chloroflexota bacterium]
MGGGLLLGIDLGGTKTRAAIADAEGRVLDELVEPTAATSAAAVAAQVAGCRDTLLAGLGRPRGDVVAAGAALPIAIHPATGFAWSTGNVPGLLGSRPAIELESALGIPVAVDNDGNCAALGEWRLGAAAGVDDVAVIAIGTGIGAGIISGGRLLRGARGGAAELAFLPLGEDPWAAASRELGAYERAVAGPAIVARVNAAIDSAGDDTRLAPGARLEAIVAAAASGDALAIQLLDEEARLVALGIAAVRAVVDPSLVVLSGGVGAVAGLLEPVTAHVATLCAEPPRLVTGDLGERAPLIGALLLAAERAETG